ncbi:MAG: hypothetical protein R3C18_18345 [Planctomycetaceae bacterium]
MSESVPETGPNRTLVGVLAVLCLLAGAAIWLFDSSENMLCAILIRTGLVLGPLWAVLPTKGRAAAWTRVSWVWIVGLVGVLFLLVSRPWVLVPIFLALFVLSMFSWGSPKKK